MSMQENSGLSDPMMAFAGDPQAALEELKDHLLTAPYSVWLDVVRRANVRRHYDLLNWMIEQPECDRSIAQLVFFQCEPAQMLERRISIDPENPDRNVICRSVAKRFADGHYSDALGGLIVGELDARIAVLKTVLDGLEPEDRVFDVPEQLMSVSDLTAEPVDMAWAAEEDEQVRVLYQANDLMVIGEMTSGNYCEAPPSMAVSVIESLLSTVRRPKA